MWKLYFYFRVVSKLGLPPFQGRILLGGVPRVKLWAESCSPFGHDPAFLAIVLVLVLALLLVLVVVVDLDLGSRLFARIAGGCIWPNIRRRNEDEGDDDVEDGGRRRALARGRLGAR